ncbi:MAG TPA: hypothetical protein VK934_02445 [Fimbriimonas sp.]|nr:hypothetical protein [Fimbriimonas sp.]
MDEKKKMMILGGLAVMMLGLGAFQFMPKGEEAPVTAAPKEMSEYLKQAEEAKAEANAPLRNPAMASALAARDPFRIPSDMSQPKTVQTVANVNPIPRPNGEMKGSIKINEPIGAVTLNQVPGVVGEEDIKPAEPEKPPFGYTVGGVAVGARSAAVFKDAQGNQRLVVEGGSLDGETKVKAVRMDHVVVVYRGEILRLPVGGETVVK